MRSREARAQWRNASEMDLKMQVVDSKLSCLVPEKGTGLLCSNRNTIPFTFSRIPLELVERVRAEVGKPGKEVLQQARQGILAPG